MKTKLNLLILASFLLLASSGFSASRKAVAKSTKSKIDLKRDMGDLGEDQAVVERARALDPNNQVKVVQSRAVDLNTRLELGVDYGFIGGGSTYLNSQIFGGNIDFHITPKWSVGARYYSYINNLSSEGRSVYEGAVSTQAAGGNRPTPPAIDSPVDTMMGVVQWYPIFGKLNFFDLWIPHFDLFTLVGFGRTNTLIRGGSNTFAAGAGFALWMSNLVSLRFEGRYQSYEDSPTLEGAPLQTRRVDNLIGQASLGILL